MKTARLRRDALPDHPWIYRKQIRETERGLGHGDPARILLADGRPAGAGLYHGRSQIGLRVLSRDPDEVIDDTFVARRVGGAAKLRERLLGLSARTDAYRVVNSEGDGFSGLIVDRYADHLVVQVKSLGVFRLMPRIAEVLLDRHPGARILYRRDPQAEKIEGFRVPEPERAATTTIHSDGLTFEVDLLAGHKTGAFLDQRDNRLLAASVAKGRDVLDLFCYEGAFALACAKAGARRVAGADLDENAVARARANAKRNGLDVAFEHGDAFEILRRGSAANFVLLDPPKWISSAGDDEAGKRRYLDLNRTALEKLPRGGLLLTSSCSGRLSPESFIGLLRTAAAQANRDLQILEVRGAAPDHPVPANFPEGRYLTAILARAP